MVSILNGRKHSVFIQLTGLMSIVSLVIVSTSMGTQEWIDAIAKPNTVGTSIFNINYGLFQGTLFRRLLTSATEYDIFFTCVWSKNSCAWSCQSSTDLRKEEVELLLDGKTPNFTCINSRLNTLNFAQIMPIVSKANNQERIFMNAGLWLSTIIFMVILMAALLISVILSIVNCTKSPIETFFNVQGIYIANGIAFVANFFVLLLYGICYTNYINLDISIFDTIVGSYSSKASLGYSYWILLLPCILHVTGIILIAIREKILNSDRAETQIDIATNVPETGVLF